MKSNGEYDWSFSSVGGKPRVNLSKGEDLFHLDELDQKLWTVLSCPVKGLETDGRILSVLDADSDGHIHVKDILRVINWLKPIINDPDFLLRGDSFIPLSLFNRKTPEGDAIFNSARHILNVLNLDQEFISTDNVSDIEAIFKNTAFNGDGVISALSTDDENLRGVIRDIITTMGPVKDRSGEDGINTDITDRFFTALQEYSQWKTAGETDKENIFPFGENTGKAYDSMMAVKDKIDDWFLRCSLASFDNGSITSLDTSTGRIGALSEKNLIECDAEIALCPLAKVNLTGTLSLTEGVNPAWQKAFDAFKTDVLFRASIQGDTLTQSQWESVKAKLAPFGNHLSVKQGAEVEVLGQERIGQLLELDAKDSIITLITKDLEYTAESDNIDKVSDLLFVYRDLYRLLNNFITFKDFYTPESGHPAIFQAGRLYIDQRCCHLCIRVDDMGKQNTMAPLSGMFLLYCNCVSKHTPETVTIAVAVTDGNIDNLREGKNGIFYDRNGMDWDATVIKVIDNPISIRQAFWTPYRRFGNFISESINKFAAEKESGIIEKGKTDLANISQTATSTEAKPQKQPFDVAKFAGLFAMIGMALGTILGFILDLFKGFAQLSLLQMALVILGIILVISGPSMIMAWLKLRKRNITPLLNANGWAINSKLLISVPFGNTLTSMAKYPIVVTTDNLKKKRRKFPTFLLIIIILILLIGGAIAYMLLSDNGKTTDNTAEPEPTVQVQDTVE